ncbi:MAG: HD domain-containing protein [Clostridia bacterium]|nr:HD domain-containing protein [Clostridia bacterium]
MTEGSRDTVTSTLTEKAIVFVKELFKGNSNGHDAAHTLRVFRSAMRIAQAEPGCDREIVALAALLHDADDHKLFQTQNNANARSFLRENHVPEDRIEQICAVINSVSFSRNHAGVPDSLEGKIVQDADRLDAVGAVGIARTFAYGGQHDRPLDESVQHFHDKLLLLKDRMNTQTAKALAESRHAFLESFLEELDAELNDTQP